MLEKNIINQSNIPEVQPVDLATPNVQDDNELKLKTKATLKRNNFVIFLILLPISLFLGLGAAFAFDAPGSEKSIPTLIFAYSPLMYVPIYIVSIILSWVLFYNKKYKIAVLSSYLPSVSILGFLIGFMLITFVCEGNFVCG